MMVQNRNLGLLLGKLFNDEQILERILLSNDMHELYVICLTIQDGYSYEEFVEFFNCLVSGCMEDLKHINEMSPEELGNVSGGRGEFNKAASATLASFLALTSVSAHNKHAGMPSESDIQSPIAISANKDQDDEYDTVTELDGHPLRKKVVYTEEGEDDEEESNKDESLGGFLSRKAKGVFEKIYNNKGKIFVGAAALATLLIAGYKTKDKPWGYTSQVKIQEEINELRGKNDRASKKRLAQLESQKNSSLNKSVLSKIADLLPIKLFVGGNMLMSGVRGILNTIHSMTNWSGEFAKNITEVQNLVTKLAPSWLIRDQNTPDYEYEHNENLTAEQRLANLDKDLELLKGQKTAKKQIKKFLATIENARRRWEEGIWAKTGANFLVFNGPSGTGKTFAASILAKNISTVKPYIITADEILRSIRDGETMWGRRPSITQVLLSAEHKNQDGTVDNLPNSMGAYAVKYKDKGTIIIDEIDKLLKYLTPEERHALEEFFRGLMDSGIVKSQYGETNDFRGMTIVLTTNETNASLEGRIVQTPDGSFLELIKDEHGNIQYVKPTQDETGTQTLIAHDPSYTQRLRGSICTFNSLSVEDFEEIVRYYLGDDKTKTKEDVIEEGGTYRVTLAERVCWNFHSVEISDESYRLIAEFAAKQPNAVRSIVGVGSQAGSVAGNYREALVDKLTAIRAEDGEIENAKFEAIAHETIDASGNPTIEFDLKFLGYADENEEQSLVTFDPTFAQQYTPSDTETGVLTAYDYEQILKYYLDDNKQLTQEEIIEAGGTPCVTVGERLSEGFDSVIISDESYKLLADYAEKQENGIESIIGTDKESNSLINNYHKALKKEIEYLKKIDNDVTNAKFEAIAYENVDENGNPVIDFGIKFLGYAEDDPAITEENKAPDENATPVNPQVSEDPAPSKDENPIEENNLSENKNSTAGDPIPDGNTTKDENDLSDDKALSDNKNSAEGNLIPDDNKAEAKNQMPDNKNVPASDGLSTDNKQQQAHTLSDDNKPYKNDLVKFDPTFAQKYKPSDNKTGVLNSTDIEQILKYYLDDDKQITKEDVINQEGTPCVTVGERLSEGFDSVKITDESYKILADYVAKQNNGIESIVGTNENSKSLVNDYHSALQQGIADFKEKGEDIQNAEFEMVAREKMFENNRLGIEFNLRLLNRPQNENDAY